MSFLSTFISNVTGFYDGYKIVRYPANIYLILVAVGAGYGGLCGFISWVDWISDRPRIQLIWSSLEGILNIARDGAYLTWLVSSRIFLNAFISFFSPITLPAIALLGKKKDQ